MSDQKLVDLHLAGDATALGRILEQYESPLLRFARALVGSPDLAQDVVQETFLRFLREGERMRDVRALFPWLLQVTRNLCYDLQRREQRMERKHDEARRQTGATALAVDPADAPSIAGESHARVRAAVDRLSPVQRDVVRLKLWEGLTYHEVAKRLGLSLSNVSYHLGQAVKAVAGQLRADGIVG